MERFEIDINYRHIHWFLQCFNLPKILLLFAGHQAQDAPSEGPAESDSDDLAKSDSDESEDDGSNDEEVDRGPVDS